MTLDAIKSEVLKCIDDINNHICECVLCQKSYNIKNIKDHNCYNKEKFIDIEKEINKKVSKKVSKKISRKVSKKVSRKVSKKVSKKVSRKSI